MAVGLDRANHGRNVNIPQDFELASYSPQRPVLECELRSVDTLYIVEERLFNFV
jgi:hypothetical protein